MIDFPVIQFSAVGTCIRCGAPASGSYIRVRPYTGQRYVRRRLLLWSPQPGIRVYPLPCSCCLWVHASGSRYVTSLPF